MNNVKIPEGMGEQQEVIDGEKPGRFILIPNSIIPRERCEIKLKEVLFSPEKEKTKKIRFDRMIENTRAEYGSEKAVA